MKKRSLRVAIGLALAGVLVSVPTSAQALDKPVEGVVEVDGPGVWQSDTYYHPVAGPIQFTFHGTDTEGTCGGAHNIALRLQGANTQYTNTLVFISGGTKRTFTRTLNKITQMPAGTYQVIARNVSGSKCDFKSYRWYGTLHL